MNIKSRFCVRCGREAKRLESGLCASCYFEREGIRAPAKVSLRVCKHCSSVEWKGSWIETDTEPVHYIENLIIEKTSLPESAQLKSIEMLDDKHIKIVADILGKEFSQVHSVEQETRYATCLDCARKITKQHQAKVQLRVEDAIGKIGDFLERHKKRIVKVEEQSTGVDIYFATKEAARHFASELRKSFSLWTKESGEAYSWDKSRNRPKYRLVILMRSRS